MGGEPGLDKKGSMDFISEECSLFEPKFVRSIPTYNDSDYKMKESELDKVVQRKYMVSNCYQKGL
jgi:hypothetical protein